MARVDRLPADAYTELLWAVPTHSFLKMGMFFLLFLKEDKHIVKNRTSSLAEFWFEISCLKQIICDISGHEEPHSVSWIQRQSSRDDIWGTAANTPCTCHQISNESAWVSDHDCSRTEWGIYHTVSDKPADHHALGTRACPLAPVH